MKKLWAFTLAETLIVIGIIGVVSALTLPNLNSSTGEKEKVAKVKKMYQNLNDAVGRAVAIYGPVEEWFVNDTTDTAQLARFTDRITEFMKISKKVDDVRFILADGTQIWVFSHVNGDGTCNGAWSYPGKTLCYSIEVDIDGPNKGKNIAGYDLFNFLVIESGVLPDDTSTHVNIGNKAAFKNDDGGYYATAWVIMNENMDYLKCFNELNWTNKTSCK